MEDELLGRQSAFQEAEALFLMIGDDNTVEELRELIAVPPRQNVRSVPSPGHTSKMLTGLKLP